MEPPQFTARVSQGVIDYRNAFAKKTGYKKLAIDEMVYRFYMEHHPAPDFVEGNENRPHTE